MESQKLRKIRLEADINVNEPTEDLKNEVASVVNFPKNKTPDMLFFSGIFVSSGENLNKAYFKPSELVKAAHTIDNKPLDIEHEEDQIVGHIYSSKFIDKSGAILDLQELGSMNESELEDMYIDVMIAGIIYKSRFPKIAEEVVNGKWKLSMETYFQDYDIKVGDVIMSRKEAESIGISIPQGILGKVIKILKHGKELAHGEAVRILKGLLFSGCGLVKNPANPKSIILETAKKKDNDVVEEIVIDLDSINNDLDEETETVDFKEDGDIDIIDVRTQTSVGICVSYKKRIYDSTFKDQRSKVIHTDWCTLYDKACTSPSRSTDHPDCLKWKIKNTAKSYANNKLKDIQEKDKRGSLLSELKSLLIK